MMTLKLSPSIRHRLRDGWRRAVSRQAIHRRRARIAGSQAGMSTAEYAIGTVAACAFAAVLYKVITSTEVLSLLSGVVTRALHIPF